MANSGTVALRTLAAIRIINGALGLLAPAILVQRLDPSTAPETVAYYPFRMFGIRTVLIGVDLLVLRGAQLERASKTAVLIHGTDTASALIGGLHREVPRKATIMTTTISAINTVLAVVAVRAQARQSSGPVG